jgi:TetR/AcrR family transcriptional regulator
MVRYKSQISSETEQRILEAARQEFIRFGHDGTSVQQIADAAHINKSLIHYYFRTKDRLFDQIFIQAFQCFVPRIEEIFTSEISIAEKIEKLISNYIDLLRENSFLPAFILHEINQYPDRLYELMHSARVDPSIFLKVIQAEIEKGVLQPVDPRHLFINIIALCVFPFAGRALLQRVFFQGNASVYNEFLEERKKEVTQFVIQAICLKK